MDYTNDFEIKRTKYMPIFPKATGHPTIYIEGYPDEDDEPMAANLYHAEQISTFHEQLKRYYFTEPDILIGLDSFIYYSEGDMKKCVAPDIYVVLGAKKYPLRRSFYTWAEGAVPDTVFEFLSESTKNEDRNRKVQIYLQEMGAKEYFIHQPDLEKTAEFKGWYRDTSGEIREMTQHTPRTLFSERLNLLFTWKEEVDVKVRLLRPYLPDGTPITTSIEEKQLREEAQHHREIAEAKVEEQAEQLRDANNLANEQEETIREQAAELEKLRQQLVNK